MKTADGENLGRIALAFFSSLCSIFTKLFPTRIKCKPMIFLIAIAIGLLKMPLDNCRQLFCVLI